MMLDTMQIMTAH